MSRDEHFCEVCGVVSTQHPQPFWIISSRFFINPCCEGCGCLTFEEYLMNATDEEKVYAFAYMNRTAQMNPTLQRTELETTMTDEDLDLPEGCGYQGYEFGAPYPDSICFGGQLYDADNCDDEGRYYIPDEEIPCPMCREADAIDYWFHRFDLAGNGTQAASSAAKSLVADIRKNREGGTEPWKSAARKLESK